MINHLLLMKTKEELEEIYNSYDYVNPNILMKCFGYSIAQPYVIINKIKQKYNYKSKMPIVPMNLLKRYIEDMTK